MKTIKQLLKEFWLPLTAAIIWTFVNFKNKNHDSWTLVSMINVFGPSFFLASWLTAQYFRVTRQAKVEDNLEIIEKRANEIFDNLETRTGLIFSQMTGGDSFCYVNVAESYTGVKNLVVNHQGNYPLYDLTIRVVDLDRFDEHSGNPEYSHTYEQVFSIGILLPKQFNSLGNVSLSAQEESKRFNIFFSARNGMFHELLRYKKINNEWAAAIKVDREKTLLEAVADNYPKSTTGEVDW